MRIPDVRRTALVALGLALSCASAGCGGDGAGTTTATFTPSTDATIQSDATIVLAGPLANTVGDTAGNLGQRVAVRFGIAPFLPAGAVVTSATLQLRQAAVAGAPFAPLGAVVVDRVDFGLGVDGNDFNPPGATAIGTLSPDATLGVKSLDVTAAVQADVAAGDLTSDFLIRFAIAFTDNDGVVDSVSFEDAENDLGTGTAPTLVVTYQ
jgi:hypothetical protein